jgi:acyl-coenzyme A synthetase/AMP-(fatty) acid ligase
VPGYELRRVDDQGNVVSDGRPGILEVRGDSSAPAYWRQHARSQQTMRGEWVVTGDLYRVDEDGFYWYEGRADDMIKVGGEWVSPIVMENALLAHPSVQEVAVGSLRPE